MKKISIIALVAAGLFALTACCPNAAAMVARAIMLATRQLRHATVQLLRKTAQRTALR